MVFQVQVPVGEHTERVEIKETVNCTCEVLIKKNTPCKRIFYVYLNLLNLWIFAFITGSVFDKKVSIFHQNVLISNKNIKLTKRAILQSTSTLTRMVVLPQKKFPFTSEAIYARTSEWFLLTTKKIREYIKVPWM